MSEAEKNLLRTHTTAVSSRMLYKLAQEGFKPAKYFSIDRVFRNEAIDKTHLAEFHQIEGNALARLGSCCSQSEDDDAHCRKMEARALAGPWRQMPQVSSTRACHMSLNAACALGVMYLGEL